MTENKYESKYNRLRASSLWSIQKYAELIIDVNGYIDFPETYDNINLLTEYKFID